MKRIILKVAQAFFHRVMVLVPRIMGFFKKNRNSRLLGHVNFDGQRYRFVKKSDKYGFISRFGH